MDGLALLFGSDGWAGLLLKGAATTAALALGSVPFGFGFGLLLALMRMAPSRILRAGCEAYCTFFRGIPDLLSLFIVYFGLQAALNGLGGWTGFRLEVNAAVAAVIALSIVVSAYSSEVWISALRSVPPGQWDAAYSLGMDRKRTFGLVVLPQLGRVALPSLGNIWTILLKDTSLVSTLAVTDLLRAASEASRATTRPLLFYGAAAAGYLVISIASQFVQGALERRSNQGYA